MFGIDGLLYVPDYLGRLQHDDLIATVDAQPWRTDLARRTQHYGYVYDYRAKTVDPGMFLGPLPGWLQHLAQRLYADALMPVLPDQAIVNEYEPGQGIADHIDCTPCFGDVVVSLSLGGPAVMDLKRRGTSVPLWLEPRSLLVLQGAARYDWTHGIARRKHDTVDGATLVRERRISVTFRSVIVAVEHQVAPAHTA